MGNIGHQDTWHGDGVLPIRRELADDRKINSVDQTGTALVPCQGVCQESQHSRFKSGRWRTQACHLPTPVGPSEPQIHLV